MPACALQLGPQVMRTRQCSARGGHLEVQLDAEHACVQLVGGARVVLRGSLSLDS